MLWSAAPPEPRTRLANYPTLLFSWWATVFSAVIILIRVGGRKLRTNRLFREDFLVLLALVPLFIRMALVHVILLFGTNNVDPVGLTPIQIYHRSIGSRLVLASRIFYAMFIWISKWAVSEFLKRIFYNSWNRKHEVILHCIRVFLAATFLVVVIATITECQPFHHYWQVVPDPGPQCRQGFAQLLSMGITDIITDVLLVVFPVPLIIHSTLATCHKFNLVLLFSFSLVLIGITGARMPSVISHLGLQQYRTVWASIEIVASAFVSNMVVVGSFLADRGVKRNRYRPTSTVDSTTQTNRRPTLGAVNSDEDLFRSIGCRMPEELQHRKSELVTPLTRPAPIFSKPEDVEKGDTSSGTTAGRRDSHRPLPANAIEERESTRDLAAWLRTTAREDSASSSPRVLPVDGLGLSDVGGLLGSPHSAIGQSTDEMNMTAAQDFASVSYARTGREPGIDLLSQPRLRNLSVQGRRSPRARSRASPSRVGTADSPAFRAQDPDAMDLPDIGGLLR